MSFDTKELKEVAASILEQRKSTSWVIVQEYLTKPLLFKNRKFDLRCYGLVVKLADRVLYFWYRQGYARTSSFEYDPDEKKNLKVHLTNEAVQVRGRLRTDADAKRFGMFEPGNKVYYDELEKYFQETAAFAAKKAGFLQDIEPQMKVDEQLTQAKALLAFRASATQLAQEDDELSFELVGFDFMIDSELKVYLIEVNKNPCLSTLSAGQGVLISKLLRDTFALVVDPFFRTHPKEPSDTAARNSGTLTDFELVHIHSAV